MDGSINGDKKYLLKLCSDSQIPRINSYYESLPSSNIQRDTPAEPDMLEVS